MPTEAVNKAFQRFRDAVNAANLPEDLKADIVNPVLEIESGLNIPEGQPPFGWSAQKRTTTQRRAGVIKPLIENPDEQRVLRQIFKWREQELSWHEIAMRLNQGRHRTRRGGLWAFNSVQRRWVEETKRRAGASGHVFGEQV